MHIFAVEVVDNDADRAKELSLQIMQLTERRALLEKNLASA